MEALPRLLSSTICPQSPRWFERVLRGDRVAAGVGSRAIAGELSQKLAALTVRLIELPAFRLAGAKEAVRQVVTPIEKILGAHEPLAREKAAENYTPHSRQDIDLELPL